ncbi:type II toxin-antitoxin system Phd/YefM family antitoxin [Streptomyces lavendulae]|uniref:type II toxin-antitoxin system Phd/YefM family antitoxin n=1 Tax=Streptomyces lavendulae TaxID=1914 RepID=UPI0036985D4D
MSSREVGIEQARKTLGDLANEVRYSGNDIILTRNGKPVARLAPLKETQMGNTPSRALSEALAIMHEAGLPIADRTSEHPLGYHLRTLTDNEVVRISWRNGSNPETSETEERHRVASLLFRKKKWGNVPATWDTVAVVPPWSEYMDIARRA